MALGLPFWSQDDITKLAISLKLEGGALYQPTSGAQPSPMPSLPWPSSFLAYLVSN